MRTDLLGAVAAVALAAPGVAHGVTIDDPTGDANGGANAGMNLATAPVSDASRDLTRVSLDRGTDGLVLRVSLAGAPDLDGPMTFTVLRGTRSGCGFNLTVAWGSTGNGDAAPVALSDNDGCAYGEIGLGSPGYSAAVDGSTLVARFPYSALERNGMRIGFATTLANLTAETRVGTYGSAGGSHSCHPEPCEPSGSEHRESAYLGPLVDATKSMAPLTAARSALRRLSRDVRGPGLRR